MLFSILQYGRQVVAALRLAVDGCADLILVYFLLLNIGNIEGITTKTSEWPRLVDRTVLLHITTVIYATKMQATTTYITKSIHMDCYKEKWVYVRLTLP